MIPIASDSTSGASAICDPSTRIKSYRSFEIMFFSSLLLQISKWVCQNAEFSLETLMINRCRLHTFDNWRSVSSVAINCYSTYLIEPPDSDRGPLHIFQLWNRTAKAAKTFALDQTSIYTLIFIGMWAGRLSISMMGLELG